MRWLFSGEGPSDLGSCDLGLGECHGSDFRHGPMARLISQLAEPEIGYELIDFADSLHFIDETSLCAKTKATPRRLQPARSKKKGVETSYYYGNAMTLGHMALDMHLESDEPVVAVLFRDCDGTRQSSPALWQDKWNSIRDGFRASGFEFGVPMLTKPKSEAWLIGVSSPTMNDCARLEDLPGNDTSPHSAKSKLDEVLGGHLSSEELCEWLRDHPVDDACAERLSTMPSFKAFHDSLSNAVRRALH
jgi:hypothetical protein